MLSLKEAKDIADEVTRGGVQMYVIQKCKTCYKLTSDEYAPGRIYTGKAN